MNYGHKVGDLVHIPQAVRLIDCEYSPEQDPQLIIPLDMHETDKPELAVIVNTSDGGYLRVFCCGRRWSVRDDRVYGLRNTLMGE